MPKSDRERETETESWMKRRVKKKQAARWEALKRWRARRERDRHDAAWELPARRREEQAFRDFFIRV